MPPSQPGATVRPADVERWLAELNLEPLARADRDGVTSWDLRLDGRRRFDLPVTLILDPALALICWVHFAPPIGDAFRKSYRKLLRWNDEFPFVKFSLAEDDRPILATELPLANVSADELGAAIARSLLIADQLLEEAAGWLWIGGRIPDQRGRKSRGAALIERFADRFPELAGDDRSTHDAADDKVGDGGADDKVGDGGAGDGGPSLGSRSHGGPSDATADPRPDLETTAVVASS